MQLQTTAAGGSWLMVRTAHSCCGSLLAAFQDRLCIHVNPSDRHKQHSAPAMQRHSKESIVQCLGGFFCGCGGGRLGGHMHRDRTARRGGGGGEGGGTFDGGRHGKSNARVATGGFYQGIPRLYEAGFFSFAYHADGWSAHTLHG